MQLSGVERLLEAVRSGGRTRQGVLLPKLQALYQARHGKKARVNVVRSALSPSTFHVDVNGMRRSSMRVPSTITRDELKSLALLTLGEHWLVGQLNTFFTYGYGKALGIPDYDTVLRLSPGAYLHIHDADNRTAVEYDELDASGELVQHYEPEELVQAIADINVEGLQEAVRRAGRHSGILLKALRRLGRHDEIDIRAIGEGEYSVTHDGRKLITFDTTQAQRDNPELLVSAGLRALDRDYAWNADVFGDRLNWANGQECAGLAGVDLEDDRIYRLVDDSAPEARYLCLRHDDSDTDHYAIEELSPTGKLIARYDPVDVTRAIARVTLEGVPVPE